MLVGVRSGLFYNLLTENNTDNNLEFKLVESVEDKHEDIEFLVSGLMRKEHLDNFPNLKLVMVPWTGLNGLDIEDLIERNIMIYNSHAHAHYVAERAFTLSLTLLGKIIKYDKLLRTGDWSNRMNNDREYWYTLFNKKIGLYGYGHIGKSIERMVKPFNCEVYTIDRGHEYKNINLVSNLDELIESVDILYISAPLTNHTENSITKKHLDNMHNKYIVNVGRGRIINEDALYNALKNETLRGYGSDVWWHYPNKENKYVQPSTNPIEDFDNVAMTPHCGVFVKDSKLLVAMDLLEKLDKIKINDYSEKVSEKKLNQELLK